MVCSTSATFPRMMERHTGSKNCHKVFYRVIRSQSFQQITCDETQYSHNCSTPYFRAGAVLQLTWQGRVTSPREGFFLPKQHTNKSLRSQPAHHLQHLSMSALSLALLYDSLACNVSDGEHRIEDVTERRIPKLHNCNTQQPDPVEGAPAHSCRAGTLKVPLSDL